MISLSNLLRLQWIYVILGAGYNIISYIGIVNGARQLSTTPPLTGLPVMLLYGLFLIPAYRNRIKAYRILMFCAILIYGWGGIMVHLINYFRDPMLYASFIAWVLAISINIFGLSLSILAVLKKFSQE